MIAADALFYGALALIGLSTPVLGYQAVAPTGLVRMRWNRHVALFDAQLRLLFVPTPAVQIAGSHVAIVLFLIVGAPFFTLWTLPLAGALAILPRYVFPLLQRARRRAIEAQLNGWLTALANTLRVTGSLPDALKQTAELTRPPLAQDVDLVLKQLRVGVPLGTALTDMAKRVGSATLSAIVTVILIGGATGGELPKLLETTAESVRERIRLEGVLRKQTAMSRMQVIVLAVSPFVIIFMFHRAEPQFFEPLVNGGLKGHLVAGGAVLLWLVALVMAKRILGKAS